MEKAIGKSIKKISDQNNIGYLDDGENVVELRLPKMDVQEFPPDICNLPHLKVLDLNFNNISEIPPAIGKLKNLEEFYIAQSMMFQGKKIHTLPNEMNKLRNLRILDLTGQGIDKLPKWTGDFSRLERLLIGGNQLESIPSELGKLRSLQELQVWSNQIKKLPKSLKELRNLQVLLLSKNRLKDIPNWITDLEALEKLDLEENQVKKLPKGIGKLTSLTELNLASNFIEKLPEDFCKLEALEFLDLSGNNLKKPLDHHCIEGLKALKWINIKTEYLTTDAMALLLDRDVQLEAMD